MITGCNTLVCPVKLHQSSCSRILCGQLYRSGSSRILCGPLLLTGAHRFPPVINYSLPMNSVNVRGFPAVSSRKEIVPISAS